MTELSPYDQLERVFHEPKRLAIISSLITSAKGKTFGELKEECDLTDGNLSRHLKTLSENGIIDIKKRFVGVRPQTTVALTSTGRNRFIKYIEALESVIKKAEKNIQRAEGRSSSESSTMLKDAKPATNMG